jgi:uncharacterized protein (DUF1786 family)
MVAALKLDARGDNATKLATGALLVILDAYDRKVTRQAFVAMATAALTVNDNIGRVCAMQAILDAVDQNGRLSLMDIQLAKADVDSYLKHSTEELQKAAYLLTQLPEDGDRVQ